MTNRKEVKTPSESESSREQKPARKTVPRGTDLALTLPTLTGTSLDLSYWDLWFALRAVNDHGGDLERMKNQYSGHDLYFMFMENLSTAEFLSAERKWNHVGDLKRRLEEASVTPAQIVDAAGDLARAEMGRADRRLTVLYTSDRKREWSVPMRDTVRKQRSEHALRGFWHQFPVSPGDYVKEIDPHFKTRHFSIEDMTVRVARTLDRYVELSDELSTSGKYAHSQALLRAWLTVIVDLLQVKAHWDGMSSFIIAWMMAGGIMKSLSLGLAVYLEIPLAKTGIDEDIFFADLLDFLIWEGFWMPHIKIEGCFKGLNQGQANLCIKHLQHEIAALFEDNLEDRRQLALGLLGQLIVEQERFDLFEDVARQLGAWNVTRIIDLVDRAMKRRKRSVAYKVLESVLANNQHAPKALKDEYEKLKRGDWNPAAREQV